MNNGAFTVKESTLMRSIGINDREVMRRVRLEVLGQEGIDWINLHGHGIRMTPDGAARIQESLIQHLAVGVAKILFTQENAKNGAGAFTPSQDASGTRTPCAGANPPQPVPEFYDCAEEKRAVLGLLPAPGKTGLQLAYVRHRPHHSNRRVLQAEIPGLGMISVRVRDYSHFVPRSQTGCLVVRYESDHWEFAGKPDIALDGCNGWKFSIPIDLQETPHCPRFPGKW